MISRVWHRLTASIALQRLNLVRVPSDASHHASDAVLKLAVRDGVDERIDTAADEHQQHAELVEPVSVYKVKMY